MKKLTETLIQQRLRTCTSDLDKVLQINITGRELQDVSILRRMTGVEILSLSVNKISSLIDFQNLKNLKELYLRHNNVSDINEIFYLRNLPKLELLMLSENPCAKDPLYRMTVIKNLRTLVELDGTAITPEERKEAIKAGKEVFKCTDSLGHAGNYIPDGPQIQRTPTQSAQKCSVMEIYEPKLNFEAVAENEETIVKKGEQTSVSVASVPEEQCGDRDAKTSRICDSCGGKGLKSNQRAQTACDDPKEHRCQFCKNTMNDHTGRCCNPHCIRIPKNSNILTAVLNLVKELDYPSLQIVNAEVISRLNSFQIDFLCHPKHSES